MSAHHRNLGRAGLVLFATASLGTILSGCGIDVTPPRCAVDGDPRFSADFSASITSPASCPVTSGTTQSFTASVLGDLNRVDGAVITQFQSALYHTNIGYADAAYWGPSSTAGKSEATPRGAYNAGTDGCGYMMFTQEDRVIFSGLLKKNGGGHDVPQATGHLTYNVNTNCGGAMASKSPVYPYESFNVTGEMNGPNAVQPITYEWTVNGVVDAETGPTLYVPGGPGGTRYQIELMMRDAVGHRQPATVLVDVKTCDYVGCNDQ